MRRTDYPPCDGTAAATAASRSRQTCGLRGEWRFATTDCAKLLLHVTAVCCSTLSSSYFFLLGQALDTLEDLLLSVGPVAVESPAVLEGLVTLLQTVFERKVCRSLSKPAHIIFKRKILKMKKTPPIPTLFSLVGCLCSLESLIPSTTHPRPRRAHLNVMAKTKRPTKPTRRRSWQS